MQADVERGGPQQAAAAAGERDRLLPRPPVAGLSVQSAAAVSSGTAGPSASQQLQAWLTGRGGSRLRGPPAAAPLPAVPHDALPGELPPPPQQQQLDDDCDADDDNDCGSEGALRTRMTLLVCLVFVSVAATQYVGAQQLQALIEGLQRAPLGSALACIVLFAAAVVLLLPGMLLSIGAGAAFGLPGGAAVAWAGTVLGQVGAFVLGRYLLRDVVAGYLTRRVPHFAEMDANIGNDGWKLVLLLRLSPVLPYNLMNYALGLTSIGLGPYTGASAAAAIPYCVLFAYLGSISSDVYSLLISPSGALLSPGWLMALACVMILSAVGLFYTCRHAITHVHGGGAAGAAAVQADGRDGRRRSQPSGVRL